MELSLTAPEARVLGSLIEKEVTTPDYYPMSVNALLNAANQRSNRDPVTSLDEDEIRQALHGLQDKGLASRVGGEGRVAKYEHRVQETFNFGRAENAIMCLLLLRGPQTPGELRGRTERLHRFDELSDVQTALQRLMQRDPPLVKVLPRQPGTKEARYIQLLAPEARISEASQAENAPEALPSEERIARLEKEVASLRSEVEELKSQFRRIQNRT